MFEEYECVLHVDYYYASVPSVLFARQLSYLTTMIICMIQDVSIGLHACHLPETGPVFRSRLGPLFVCDTCSQGRRSGIFSGYSYFSPNSAKSLCVQKNFPAKQPSNYRQYSPLRSSLKYFWLREHSCLCVVCLYNMRVHIFVCMCVRASARIWLKQYSNRSR